jgi:hypothetical protein
MHQKRQARKSGHTTSTRTPAGWFTQPGSPARLTSMSPGYARDQGLPRADRPRVCPVRARARDQPPKRQLAARHEGYPCGCAGGPPDGLRVSGRPRAPPPRGWPVRPPGAVCLVVGAMVPPSATRRETRECQSHLGAACVTALQWHLAEPSIAPARESRGDRVGEAAAGKAPGAAQGGALEACGAAQEDR